jgi:hypothetical protein
VPFKIESTSVHMTLLFDMGWQGGHIHEFVIGHRSYGRNDTSF